MRILVCDDTRSQRVSRVFPAGVTSALDLKDSEKERIRENANSYSELIRLLREDGHQVSLFDGWDDRSLTRREKDRGKLTSRFIAALDGMAAEGLVLDLYWHGDGAAGMQMLNSALELRRERSANKLFVVVYSKFVKDRELDFIGRLERECNVPANQCIDRFTSSIDAVVNLFK